MTIRTKETDMNLAKQLIVGFKQHMAAVSSLTVMGVPYTQAEVEAFLQAADAPAPVVAAPHAT